MESGRSSKAKRSNHDGEEVGSEASDLVDSDQESVFIRSMKKRWTTRNRLVVHTQLLISF